MNKLSANILRRLTVAAVLGYALFGANWPLYAVTVTLGASHDASIFANNQNNASGAGNALFAGTNSSGSPRRALLAFDLTGIPPSAVVQSASLTLYLGQYAGQGGGAPGGGTPTSTIELHRIQSPWGEGVTQLSDPLTDSLVGVGQGDPAEDGDVTWLSRFHNAAPEQLWENPGGDFDEAVSASLVVSREVDTPFTWDSTAALVGNVQAWVSSPGSNHGWMLVNETEEVETNFRAFYTRDVSIESHRPTLTITYATASPLTADFNDDQRVDGVDFLTWQRGFGKLAGATPSLGDATGEGAVDALDFAAWRGQFGMGSSQAGRVPEPGGLGLAAGAMVGAIFAASRRCRLTDAARGLMIVVTR